MRKRYSFPLTVVVILLLTCMFLTAGYFLYYELVPEQNIVVDTPLSINYEGDNYLTDETFSKLLFSVTNNGDETVEYYIVLSNVSSDKSINYSLINGDKTTNGIFEDAEILNSVEITPGETHNYEFDLEHSNADFIGNIMVKRNIDLHDDFSELILNNNETKNSPTTKVAETISISNEGLIKIVEDEKTSYYFRGNVENNYVSFADYTWRILKINPDGTIKIVLDDILDTYSTYSSDLNKKSYVDSDIKVALENWYNLRLQSYNDIISNQTYCNDNSIVNDSHYAAYNRAALDKIASYICLGDNINQKVGLLTVDEVLFAGGVYNQDNTSYFLNSENIDMDYYLMSSAKETTTTYYPFAVSEDGKIIDTKSYASEIGIRPVITITKNISVSGEGTKDNPYNIEM